MGEVGEGRPVELGGRHEVRSPALASVEDGVADGGRAGADRQRRRPPLERGDPLLEDVDGRVVDPVVVEAGRLEVEHRTGVAASMNSCATVW